MAGAEDARPTKISPLAAAAAEAQAALGARTRRSGLRAGERKKEIGKKRKKNKSDLKSVAGKRTVQINFRPRSGRAARKVVALSGQLDATPDGPTGDVELRRILGLLSACAETSAAFVRAAR